MWKLAFIVLVTALAVLAAQLLMDASLLQPHVGAATRMPVLMYGGIRG